MPEKNSFPVPGTAMVFVDLNTFYGPKAGGIRTFHAAKVEWFGKQSEHVYCLIYPGPAIRVDRPYPTVYLIQAYGPALTRDPQGYRLLLGFGTALAWIRRLKPQVVEAGDAWTGAFCLLTRALGFWRGRLESFFHSDMPAAYIRPWAAQGGKLRRAAAGLASAFLDGLQRRYDATAVASRGLEAALRARGIRRLRLLPFGVHPAFFDATASSDAEPLRRLSAAPSPDLPLRCLYAGRLDPEKDAPLLLEILPRLLADPRIHVTVAGRGALADRFAVFRHERFRYEGFLNTPEEMAALFSRQDLLLAPGRYETFGLAVLEGMAAGLAVAGPDAGGSGELLEEAGSPFRFRAGDAEDFLAKILSAAESDLAAASARSREAARRYGTWDEAVARMTAAREARG